MKQARGIHGSLVRRQTLEVVGVVLLTSFLVGAAAYATTRSSLRAEIDARLSAVADHRATMVEQWVDVQKRYIALVASRTRLRAAMSDLADGTLSAAQFRDVAEPILGDALVSTGAFVALEVVGTDGVVLASTTGELDALVHAESYMHGRDHLHIGDPWMEGAELRAEVSAPAVDTAGKLVGVVVGVVQGAGLLELIDDPVGLGDTGRVQLVRGLPDGGYQALVEDRADGIVPELAFALEGATGFGETSSGGAPVLSAWRPVEFHVPEEARWAMAVVIDRNEAYAPMRRLESQLFAINALLLLFGAAMAYAAARALSRPILRIAAAADRLAAGDLDARVHLDQPDELGRLSDAFDSMAAELGAMKRGLEAQVAERTAELEQTVRELERARDAAEEANVAKSRFLANMSHELRTPLNAVLGFSELILEDAEKPPSEEHAEYLRKIVSSGRHLLALIEDVLDLARIESGNLRLRYERVELGEIVRLAADRFELAARDKDVDLDVELDGPLVQVRVDPVRFRQILLNLLSNAVKFTPAGGRVVVRVRTEGDRLAVEVEDTGVGIPHADIERIFDEFEQTDEGRRPEYGGTGLGLALVRRLVSAMGGSVRAESKLGEGSRFTVELPVNGRGASESSDRMPRA